MAETANIAAAAERLSEDLFSVLGWTRAGPMNIDWECASEEHGKKTHPTDAVFRYEDPYGTRPVLVQTDLKSYAKGSISPAAVGSALRSLALATDCTRRSEKWQEHYRPSGTTGETVGLLFIYNHDGEFDADFAKLLGNLDEKSVPVPKGCRVHVLGPKDIEYLVTVTTDLKVLRGEEKLPPKVDCGFFAPHLVQRLSRDIRSPVAPLETLSSPWLIYRYAWRQKPQAPEGCIVYLRSSGESADELMYLLDYLFHFQIIEGHAEVKLRAPYAAPTIHTNLAQAKANYAAAFPGQEYVHTLLERVTVQTVTNIAKRFLFEELGMNRG